MILDSRGNIAYSYAHIPNSQVVCYCVLGHRAAYVFTQLKIAGYENVKLCDGSFADWVGRRIPLG